MCVYHEGEQERNFGRSQRKEGLRRQFLMNLSLLLQRFLTLLRYNCVEEEHVFGESAVPNFITQDVNLFFDVLMLSPFIRR